MLEDNQIMKGHGHEQKNNQLLFNYSLCVWMYSTQDLI